MKTFSRNTSGFSLIEVLVGIGLAGLMALGVAAMSSTMLTSAMTAERTQENTALRYEVYGLLNNKNACSAAFAAAAIPPTAGQAVPLIPGRVESGQNYGRITLTSVTLQNVMPIGSHMKGEIRVQGEKNSQIYGSKGVDFSAPFYFNVAGGLISDCLGIAENSSYCASLGGFWDGTGCNFCEALGGTLSSGNCLMPGSNPSPFYWDTSPWGTCTSGTQNRTVTCIDISSSASVAGTNCFQPPPVASQSCTGTSPGPTCAPAGAIISGSTYDCPSYCYAGAAASCTGGGGLGPGVSCDPSTVASMCTSMCGSGPVQGPSQPNAACCSGTAHSFGAANWGNAIICD